MAIKKKERVEKIISKWKKFLKHLIIRRKDDCALGVISALATFLYEWNQEYVDIELENYLDLIAQRNLHPSYNKNQCNNDTVLYYDSFGYDNRGLTIIYLKSLCELGYKVVYVCPEGQEQPILENATKDYGVIWRFVPKKNTLDKAYRITDLFNEWKPSCAFLYALPSDSAAVAVFNVFKNIITRFQINLTDHAFWLGINAFDYCIEFRDYGATVTNRYRRISKSNIILLPYYPYIDKTIPFEGFSQKFDGKKIIFSGGSVKKTLGDKDHLYYKMVKKILLENTEAAFLYAGSGPDTTELDELISQFSSRAERISERKDLYQVLKHSTIFLNTYPDCGGLTTQYSVVAGRLPITLCNEQNDLSGLVNNRELLKVEFKDIDQLTNEVRRILSDDNYRVLKESYLADSIISENTFSNELKNVIESNMNKFVLSTEEYIDLQFVRDQYVRSFNIEDQINWAISTYKINACVFPIVFVRLCVRKFLKMS